MLPLKLVRSLVLGDAINNPFLLTHQPNQNHHHENDDEKKIEQTDPRNPKSKTPLLIFTPTKEIVKDTYRLARLAREIGLDLYPNPSLSHIIFSWSLPNDAVPLPFPSLSSASLYHLRCFISLTKGFFKLGFLKSDPKPIDEVSQHNRNWDCCSFSLVFRLTGDRIDSMDGFSRALAGMGWTLYKTKETRSPDSGDGQNGGAANSVYLFRKMDSNRVRAQKATGNGGNSSGGCRIRELRLPTLDFRNAPLRILQYILLMTDDIFYLS